MEIVEINIDELRKLPYDERRVAIEKYQNWVKDQREEDRRQLKLEKDTLYRFKKRNQRKEQLNETIIDICEKITKLKKNERRIKKNI